MNPDSQKFRLPIKHDVSISAELAVKASAYAAGLRPPRSLDAFVEQLILAALDRAPQRFTFQYRPERETR